MKKLMNMLMLSCKKASGFIEKREHVKLSPMEQIQLFVHTHMCKYCKSYQGHSKSIDTILKNNIRSTSTPSSLSGEYLSEEFKTRLIKKLEK